MPTKVTRIIQEDYNAAISLLESERERVGDNKTPYQKQILASETNWISHIVDKGIKAYVHDNKIDRKVE